jgi:hypothetical protein
MSPRFCLFGPPSDNKNGQRVALEANEFLLRRGGGFP